MHSLFPGPAPKVPARQLLHVSLLFAPVSGLNVPRGHCRQSADELLPACSLYVPGRQGVKPPPQVAVPVQ